MKISKIFKFVSLALIAASPYVFSQEKSGDDAQANAASGSKSEKTVTVGDVTVEGNVSDFAKQNIDAKKSTLFKHIYEQQQLEALRDALEAIDSEEQFSAEKKSKAPFSAEKMQELRLLEMQFEKSKNKPLTNVTYELKTIEIEPDAPSAIELRVVSGHPSTILFFDQTGKPWPIEGEITGDKTAFTALAVPKKQHIANFVLEKPFVESSASINLEGLDIPIIVKLKGNDEVVDSRLSVRIPLSGPNAKVDYQSETLVENNNPDLLNLVSTNHLDGAKKFNLNGVNGSVFLKNNLLYIRTRSVLISPPSKSSLTSLSDYNAYEIHPVTSLVFSDNGVLKTAYVEKAFEVQLKQKTSIFEDK